MPKKKENTLSGLIDKVKRDAAKAGITIVVPKSGLWAIDPATGVPKKRRGGTAGGKLEVSCEITGTIPEGGDRKGVQKLCDLMSRVMTGLIDGTELAKHDCTLTDAPSFSALALVSGEVEHRMNQPDKPERKAAFEQSAFWALKESLYKMSSWACHGPPSQLR